MREPHPLFDPRYYAQSYGDATLARKSPLIHFLNTNGDWADPHPLFDAAFYLRRDPDVRASGLNPLLHYVRYGAWEGRKPHPLFDPRYYAAELLRSDSRKEIAFDPLSQHEGELGGSPSPV